MKALLYESLSKVTKYRINKFDIDALKRLHKIQTNKSRISTNSGTLLILTETNKIFHCESYEHQISESNEYDPIIISGLNNIIQLAQYSDRKYCHSLVLLNNGQVYGSGNNKYGQLGLGLGYKHNREQYCLIPELNDICYIATEKTYSLFLTIDGRVYSVGRTTRGQLGRGSCFIRLGLTFSTFEPEKISELHNIISISTCENHSLALTSDGEVYGFGENDRGQLGLGDKNLCSIPIPTLILANNIIQIATGTRYSLALTDDGKVYAFGYNANINVGLGNYINYCPTLIDNLPYIVQIGLSIKYGLLLDINGKVHKIGNNYDTPILMDELNNIVQISDRGYHKLWY